MTKMIIRNQKKEDLSAQEKERLLDNILQHKWLNYQRLAQWCGHLSRLCDELISNTGESFSSHEALFWIRLWVVLTELHERYQETKASGVANSFAISVATTIEKIRSSLSEDELIWIDYRRQIQCHVFQAGYRMGVTEDKKKGPRLKDTYLVKTIPKRFSVEALDKITTAVLSKYKSNDVVIAKKLANKISRDVERLWKITDAEWKRQADKKCSRK